MFSGVFLRLPARLHSEADSECDSAAVRCRRYRSDRPASGGGERCQEEEIRRNFDVIC